MTEYSEISPAPTVEKSTRDWVKILAYYREPDNRRSMIETCITILPFLLLWALAWWSLSFSYWVALGISVFNSLFLLRLFAIQHDCGHGAFFANRKISDWVGRVIGVLTLTPYDVWRRTHSAHHNGSGNLARRGMGDIHTNTVEEFRALSTLGKLKYRVYRHPLTLFCFAPGYLFFLQNRIPLGLMRQTRYWISAIGTNIAIFAALLTVWYFGGFAPILLIFLPTTLLAATAGMWLFYVQHQFENTYWARHGRWEPRLAAMQGSSFYDLPPVLRWFTGNIGYHHIHHLDVRIPNYRLRECFESSPLLQNAQRLTLRSSLRCASLKLWDEQRGRLVGFPAPKAA